MRQLVELAARVAELERRVAGLMRHGTVEAGDPAKHRLRMGEDPKRPLSLEFAAQDGSWA